MDAFDDRLRIPKYIQLKETLRADIEAGKFGPDAQLPSRNQLIELYEVSDTTVRKAIEDLTHEGYLYRIQGKGTFVADRRRQPAVIALMLPSLCWVGNAEHSAGYDTVPRMAQSVQEAAQKSGASVMLYLCREDIAVERENLREIMHRKVDALITFYIGGSANLDALEAVRRAGIQIVLIDRYADGIDLDYVVSENRDAAYRATSYLADLGYKRIFHLSMDSDWTSVRDRREGYETAMREHGLRPDITTETGPPLDSPGDEASCYAWAYKALADVGEPFAVFALNAPMFRGAYRALTDLGIPHTEYAMATFDESYISVPPDILSIKILQQFEEIGRRSVDVVMQKLRGDKTIHRIALPPSIMISGDTGRF